VIIAQLLASSGQRIPAVVVTAEHSLAGEMPQNAIECIRLGVGDLGELSRGPSCKGDVIGDP